MSDNVLDEIDFHWNCPKCGESGVCCSQVIWKFCPYCGSELKIVKEDDEEFAALAEAEEEAEQDKLRGEAEARFEAESREQYKIAREEEQEHESTGPEGEPEA